MKKTFLLLIILSLGCKNVSLIDAKIIFDKKQENLEVIYTNLSEKDYYFLTPFLIGIQNEKYLQEQSKMQKKIINSNKSKVKNDSVATITVTNDLPIITDLDLRQQCSKLTTKEKVIAYNYLNSAFEANSYGPLYTENTKPSNEEIDVVSTFIKRKSTVKIIFKIRNVDKKKKYVCYLKSWSPLNSSKNRINAIKTFYNHGKIGEYYPYSKDIECKSIFIEF